MSKLEKLMKALLRAEADYLAELKRAYPVGTKVQYRLRGGKDAHRYPWQEGEIVGYHKDGRRLRVRLAPSRASKITDHGDRHVESLPPSKVRATPACERRGG